MKIIETGPRKISFVLWGHCQNLLDDPRISDPIIRSVLYKNGEDPESFVRGDPTVFFFFFLVDDG